MIPRFAAPVALVVCGVLAGWGTRAARGAEANLATLPTVAGAAVTPGGTPPGMSIGNSARRSAAPSVAPSSADSDQDIRDIHGPIATPSRRPVWWLVAAASAVGVVAVGFALRARHRRRPVPPHERALRALAGANSLIGSNARDFSFVVSEIVRSYVEEAFPVRAAHRTTEELLSDLALDTSPVATHRKEVGEFLRYCDLAKFAGWSLSRTDMAAMLGSAETFIRATGASLSPNPVGATAVGMEGLA